MPLMLQKLEHRIELTSAHVHTYRRDAVQMSGLRKAISSWLPTFRPQEIALELQSADSI
jgi:hypothetical protein